MADVITSQPNSVAVVATPAWATEIRKYAVETIGAFFLTFVVVVSVLSHSVFTPLAAGATLMLNVATSKDQPGNGFFGLAIGFTVTAGAFAVGGISGGLFNPAVTLGGATAGLFAWSTIWVYLVVQLGAGIAAGLAFLVLNPGDGVLRTYTGGPNQARSAGSSPVPAPRAANP